MVIAIPDVLSASAARALREAVLAADWVDGNATSGGGAALAKHNRQLPDGGDAITKARAIVQQALAGSSHFLSAALPYRVVPPLFNRYGIGDQFDLHVDNAIRVDPISREQIRTDLSATLFLTDPDAYDGGELEITGSYGSMAYRLPAGQLLLYPASSLHRVTPITRGERISCFFWLQSLVREHAQRETLFALDQSVQRLTVERGVADAEVLRLTNIYHNLIRQFAL
jgi:PKHD-type hydroxylase